MSAIIKYLKALKNNISKYRFCYYKTLLANFKLLPFKQAIHLPLVIYGPTQLVLSRAKIKLNVKPRFGLIKWGYNQDFFVPTKMPSMLFMINGLLIINGPIRVSPGVVFRISGVAKFGEHIEIGGGCKILANNYIEIGEFTRFAFGSIVCDTNYHYVVNNNIVQRKEGKVLIGASVWIGNSCSIVKGAIIPKGSIVSNKSFVNKDFSDYHKMILLAGSPAKVIKEHCTHIRSSKLEKEIDEFFKDNNDMSICDFNMTYFDDEN